MGGKGKKEGRWGGGGKRHKGQRSDGRVFALKTADISFYPPSIIKALKSGSKEQGENPPYPLPI